MFRIKVIHQRRLIRKVFIALFIIFVAYLFSNTLLLTNKVKFYLNNQKSTFIQIQTPNLLEFEFLKSHIHNALPIIKLIFGQDDEQSARYNEVGWIMEIIAGLDIKNPRSIICNQVLLMSQYDDKIVSALSNINENEMLRYANKEKETYEFMKNELPLKLIDELIIANNNNSDGTGEIKELTSNITEITVNPVNTKGYEFSENIYIKNETSFKINISNLLKEKLKIDVSKKGAKVLIIHTHTSEAYTPTNKNFYIPSDPDRTEDSRYNVVRVGEELTKNLERIGIEVIHDKTIHDYPSYSGSYQKSLQTIQSQLKKYPAIKFVFDIHRDAFLLENNKKLAVSTQINGEKVAQIMFVAGTSQSGLEHPNWIENLKLALRLQDKSNVLYPSFARPIDLRKERFNQHASIGGLIIEVGSNGNTLEEALASCKYLANILAEVIMNVRN